jgi:hypothetical protein
MTDDLRAILGDDLAHRVELMLAHYEGSWPDATAFVRSAVESRIRDSRPDYIGVPPMALPRDWPWPPDPTNPEHARYYQF